MRALCPLAPQGVALVIFTCQPLFFGLVLGLGWHGHQFSLNN